MKPVAVHEAVLQALLACGGRPDPAVVDGVRQLSELFTVARARLGFDYLSVAALRRAYLLYFAPVNIAKVLSILAEVPVLPARPLQILDLGSGPGVGALALLQYLSSQDTIDRAGTEVVLVDRSGATLDDARSLWTSVASTARSLEALRLRTVLLDLERPGSHAPWKRGTFDLVLLVNSLNELFRSARDPIARRTKLVEQLVESLAPDGTLVVIEPALRKTTRELHEIRDRILSRGQATVYSPCLHDRPCPALVHPDDWCHEERPWDPPGIVKEIDRSVGFIKDALKFSYLVLRRDGRTIVDRAPDVYRVVSERMAMKGEQRVWLCNETGRQLVGRLDKERSKTNAGFDLWERGTIVRVTEIDRPGSVGRIRETAKAEVVRGILGEGSYSNASKEDFSEKGCRQD
ncbi:MAG TPA: small ribosomal subunit Rsm22 family protein [Nitrospirales bacterium]|jgi:ribosomal protein RSM22 (predicted rRNA methylase)